MIGLMNWLDLKMDYINLELYLSAVEGIFNLAAVFIELLCDWFGVNLIYKCGV